MALAAVLCGRGYNGESLMALDSPKRPFSKRYGYRSQSKEISVWEDPPENLRHFVLDTAVEMGYGPYPLREAICSVLNVRPDPSNWSEYPNVWGEAEGHATPASGSSSTILSKRSTTAYRSHGQATATTPQQIEPSGSRRPQ